VEQTYYSQSREAHESASITEERAGSSAPSQPIFDRPFDLRRGEAEEIAQAILASGEGAFTVGSEFVIDDGMSNL
jgi:hypothetical protein